MTNPNIAGINTLRGQSSTRQYVNIVPGDLLVNDVDSNEVLKVDSITISNTDPANPHDVSVEFVRNNVAYKVVSTVSVPADSTLNVIVRDYGFYLLEGDKLRIFGSFSGALHATCSYEQISDVSVPVRPDDYDPAVPFDAFFNQTVLLLHGDGTNGAQNNTFIDGSSNNFTITRNGNTTQGTFTPFSAEAGKWSASLAASGDGLTSTSNAAFGFGSGDFTIEFWVYYNSGTFPADGRFFTFGTTSGNLNLTMKGGIGVVNESVAHLIENTNVFPDLGTWTHIAFTRSGSTIRLFKNGIQFATATSSVGNATGELSLQRADVNLSYSNFRVIKGTALYTSDFTLPTSPLTAISGTSLLTCQDNTFKDNSSNNIALDATGNIAIRPFSPFTPTSAYSTSVNGGSGYFDGTGDYLSVPANSVFAFGTGDYTIEAWIYPTSATNNNLGILTTGTTAATTNWQLALDNTLSGLLKFAYTSSSVINALANAIAINSWNHVAATRSGTTVRLFVNGVLQGSATDSTNLTDNDPKIGANRPATQVFNGYISNARLLKGTALYTADFTPPTAPLTAITNTSLLMNFTNAGIFDNSGKNNLETFGNAQIDTTTKKFGTGALEFDGTGDYLAGPYNSDIDLLTGSFTIEGWIYPTSNKSVGMRIFSTGGGTVGWNSTTGIHVLLQISANPYVLDFQISNGTASQIGFVSTLNVPLNDWTHIAAVYDATTSELRVFVNGTMRSNTRTGVLRPSTNPSFTVGTIPGEAGGSTTAFQGFIDDLRVTKGVARYSSSFTPLSAPYEDL